MKYSIPMLFCLSVLVLTVGCAGNNIEDTNSGSTNGAASEPTVINVDSQCPDCNCPSCQTCEVCPQSSTGSIELALSGIKLLQQETKNEQETEYRMDSFQYENLESFRLIFLPKCGGNVHDLTIKIEDDEIFEGQPDCDEVNVVDVDVNDVDSRRADFVFSTHAEENYRITNIKIEITLEDGTNASGTLDAIKFEAPDEDDEEEIGSLADFSITNFREYYVELEEEEAEQDITLEFDGDEREGSLLIYVNDELVSDADIKKRSNEVVIDAKYLEDGENYFLFVGTS